VSFASLPQPFTGADARAAGITARMLSGLTGAGLIRRVLRATYVDARVPDSLQLRAEALSRVVPDGALVCRGSAAWLYGVDVQPMTRQLTVPAVELMVPDSATVPRRAGCKAFSGRIEPRDIEIVHGIPVTTPVRTGVDLARYRPVPTPSPPSMP